MDVELLLKTTYPSRIRQIDVTLPGSHQQYVACGSYLVADIIELQRPAAGYGIQLQVCQGILRQGLAIQAGIAPAQVVPAQQHACWSAGATACTASWIVYALQTTLVPN